MTAGSGAALVSGRRSGLTVVVGLAALALACGPPGQPTGELWRAERDWIRLDEGWAWAYPLRGAVEVSGPPGSRFAALVVPPPGGVAQLTINGGTVDVEHLTVAEPLPLSRGLSGTLRLASEGAFLVRPRVLEKGFEPSRRALVVVDTLRADHVTAELMPEVLARFRDGLTFRQAFSTAAWTLPSLASIFSGKPPTDLRLPDGTLISIPPDVRTLASALGEQGWGAVAVTANWTVNHENGYSQGFDLFVAPKAVSGGGAPDVSWLAEHALRAARWLADDKLFLFLQPMEPHDPYRDHETGRVESSAPTGTPLAPGRLDAMKAAYASEVRYLDRRLGTLVDELGPFELLVLTADHGEELLDHGGLRHGATLFPEVTRVPLLVAGRQVDDAGLSGREVAEPVSLLGIWPLLVDGDLGLQAGRPPVSAESFAPPPPRWMTVVGGRQWILRARQLPPVAEDQVDPVSRWLRRHHPPLEVLPLDGAPAERPAAPEEELVLERLVAQYRGYRRGSWLVLRGAGTHRLETRELTDRAVAWGAAARLDVALSGRRAVFEVDDPEPFVVLFAPQDEPGAWIDVASGEPVAAAAGPPPSSGGAPLSLWWDPGRPPVAVRGQEETLERLRALGYVQ